MLKVIALPFLNELLPHHSIYDGNQDQIRAIYQDCLEEMRTAKWEHIGFNPYMICEKEAVFSENLLQKLNAKDYSFKIHLKRGNTQKLLDGWKDVFNIFQDQNGDFHIHNIVSESDLLFLLYCLAIKGFPKENLMIDEQSHFNLTEQLTKDIDYFCKDFPQNITPDSVTIIPINDTPEDYYGDIMNHLLSANKEMALIKKQTENCDEKSILNHALLFRYNGKIHLALHIYELYSDISYYAVKALLKKWPHIQINQCGIAGALSKELPIGGFIIPNGIVKNIDHHEPSLLFQNSIVKTPNSPQSLIFVKDGHYGSPCRFKEHESALARMQQSNGKTIECETYPIIKAIEEAKKEGNTSVPNPKIIHIIANYTVKTNTSDSKGMEKYFNTQNYQSGLKLLSELLF